MTDMSVMGPTEVEGTGIRYSVNSELFHIRHGGQPSLGKKERREPHGCDRDRLEARAIGEV